MYGRGSFIFRVLGVLVLAGLLLAGGALLFRAGQVQGYQMGAAAGAALSAAADGGEAPGAAPVTPYGPGYWPAYGPAYWPGSWPHYPGPHFGFFPFFPFGWLCGSILLVFLALFALRLIFRPWGWRHHGKSPGGWGPYGWGPPPWAKEQGQTETGAGGAKPSGVSTGPDQPAGGSPA